MTMLSLKTFLLQTNKIQNHFNVNRFARISTKTLVSEISTRNSSPLIVDLTYGDGDTTRKYLDLNNNIRVIGVDCDPEVDFEESKKYFSGRFHGFLSRWSQLPATLSSSAVERCSLMLLETGPSHTQSRDKTRGFSSSLEQDGFLDLRYDPRTGINSAKLVQLLDADSLRKILKVYGGTVQSKMIAREIVERRYLLETIETRKHLHEVLTNFHDRERFWEDKTSDEVQDNIESVFRALRMFTNDEINELQFAVRMAEKVLEHEGLFAVTTTSEHEKNILNKCIFRNSGLDNCSAGWRIYSEDGLQMIFMKT